MKPIYTIQDVGCYGDGALGHQHTRERCADVICGINGVQLLWESLRKPVPDDAWDEDEACDLLDSVTAEGLWWGWQDGDFGLWLEDDEE